MTVQKNEENLVNIEDTLEEWKTTKTQTDKFHFINWILASAIGYNQTDQNKSYLMNGRCKMRSEIRVIFTFQFSWNSRFYKQLFNTKSFILQTDSSKIEEKFTRSLSSPGEGNQKPFLHNQHGFRNIQ